LRITDYELKNEEIIRNSQSVIRNLFSEKAMKILHVNKFFDRRDGVDIYLDQLMHHQAERGHEVHILATRAPSNIPTPDVNYFVHRFDYAKSEGIGADVKKASAFLWNREAMRAMDRVLREIRPDIVHLHNIYHHLSTSILAPIRLSGIRCVQTLHDWKLACPNYSMFTQGSVCERCKGGRYWNAVTHGCLFPSLPANTLGACEMALTKMNQAYEKTVYRFIAPSDFLRTKMIEWGEPASKFTLVRNPGEVAANPSPRGGGYLLGVGRLAVTKGFETLITAAARIPTISIRIAGTGPDEERLKHLARSLGATNVSFLGFVHPTTLADLRTHADAVVVPSVWYENCPLVILEALGDGIPVLASDIGGIPELVTDGVEGLLAVPGNVDAWVANLQTFQSLSEDRRREMGEQGQARIRGHHGWDEHLERLDKVYLGKG
jgi:glycosyltransferase involved in cell wall biosynthesis